MQQYIRRIDEHIRHLKKDNEYEIIFAASENSSSISLEQFRKILDWLKTMKSSYNESRFETRQMMDISYKMQDRTLDIYRLSLDNKEEINHVILNFGDKKMSTVIAILVRQFSSGDNKNISLIMKGKESFNNLSFDMPEYNTRVRKSLERSVNEKEITMLTHLRDIDRTRTSIRLKHRISLVLLDTDSVCVRIDLTSVRADHNISRAACRPERYELELEIYKKDDSEMGDNERNTVIEIMTNIIQQLNGTQDVITTNEKQLVIRQYSELLKIKNPTKLVTMQPISLNMKAFMNNLPNGYSVTDKADGEKVGVIVTGNKLYTINNNMKVVPFAYPEMNDASFEKYNNSIFEAELVDKRLMIFDALFFVGEDVRQQKLTERLSKCKDFVNTVNPGAFKHPDFDQSMNYSDYEKFIVNTAEEYTQHINTHKNTMEVKLFFTTTGIHGNEIYKYAYILYSALQNIDYELDGMIFTHINQSHTGKIRDIKHFTYKWKPTHLNSLDVYLELRRDDNNRILHVFDNTTEGNHDNEIGGEATKQNTSGSNDIYQIGTINVGHVTKMGEEFVPFLPHQGLSTVHLVEKNGKLYDKEGSVINDKTVVEIIYNDDKTIPVTNRWQVLRTRYDKTHSVNTRRRQYGNNEEIAQRVWETITNPIRWDDFEALGKGDVDSYESVRMEMGKRLSLKDVKTTDVYEKDNSYYQERKKICATLTKYHNYIKSILMYTYFMQSPELDTNGNVSMNSKGDIKYHKPRLLDVGVGEGGDILKIFHCKARSMVGIDANGFGLTKVDGAINRYNMHKKRYPGFTNMEFIHADMGAQLDMKNQKASLKSISQQSLEQIKKYFGTKSQKFDGINCQFMIHYLFRSQETLKSLCTNINRTLNDCGYMIVTTFDGNLVKEFLGSDDSKDVYYTDDAGARNTFFSIKRGQKELKDGVVGQPIDFHFPEFMGDGEYLREYLVFPEHIRNVFEKECNMRMVESLTFKELYEVQRPFFTKARHVNENKGLLEKTAEFYNLPENPMDVMNAAFQLTSLNRYYIFRKNGTKTIYKEQKN